MKRTILLMLVLSVCACENKKNQGVILSGVITNKASEEFVIVDSNSNVRDTIQISENGSFKDTLYIEEGIHLINYGSIFFRAYFEKEKDLGIHFDTKDFKNSLAFSGQGAENNIYLLNKKANEYELIGRSNDFFSMEEATFKAKSMDIKNELLKLLDANTKVSEVFKSKEKRNINYEFLSRLQGYQQSHGYATNQLDFKTSEGFGELNSKFDYNKGGDFLFSSAYKRLVKNYISKTAKKLEQTDGLSEDIAYLTAVSKILNDTIKNSLLFDDARYGITYTSDLTAYYNIFIKASTNEVHKQEITESYNLLKKVSKGEPSPEFYAYENYNGEKTSLRDLKGKYLYIDVWATWCGPCKKEIPYLKEVEKLYRDKNIEFVSISIDKHEDRDKWIKMIEDKELQGVQLLADNAWQSQFVKDYLIKGIPKFILLDPKGIIINSNAPRPSEEELVQLLNTLFN
ncbi:TlpA family protein disulfide reductase [Aestuariibaculum suncheonense]|uniref:TlpA family protein disulfide reductase n=1 Tax=Aestuariibaculum suncheonense TaxID=1028745 RepID=A0A8J6Q7Q9_9FLAO|nr:TlpA disulfide reductase family protein [Aestuariibaculum suncheonense]MBD0835657.1 TlpA family protein disulfide reductase [Aestuariibaculum suncheonense]